MDSLISLQNTFSNLAKQVTSHFGYVDYEGKDHLHHSVAFSNERDEYLTLSFLMEKDKNILAFQCGDKNERQLIITGKTNFTALNAFINDTFKLLDFNSPSQAIRLAQAIVNSLGTIEEQCAKEQKQENLPNELKDNISQAEIDEGVILNRELSQEEKDMNRIDTLARAGYDYAVSNGKDNRSSMIETDMDLMAFNAGISNANIKHNLSVKDLLTTPTTKRHDNRRGRSDKEIAVCF